jgi:transposase-like protein
MTIDLTNPIFHDETAAREYFEAVRWPDGPVCPHCGSVRVTRMEGEAHRAGLFNCRDCRNQFSATVGTVFERSHIPLHKWMLANHLMNASKKGVSAHQLHRTLSLPYKTAWFMAHRLREAMRDPTPTPLGGEGKVIEADEAYHGKREIPREPQRHDKYRAKPTKRGKGGGAQKRPIVALVERGGEARAVHMNTVTSKNLRDFMVKNVSRKSKLHTDESNLYPAIGAEFARHETVNHANKEYARGKGDDLVTTNSAEGFFGVFKRGMTGVYQHCGEQHLQRYLDEFTFRYNNRIALGVNDTERAETALRGAEGKRLTYRRINAA